MYTLNIAQLVCAALEASGCDPAVVGNLDSHSTIALDLHDLPTIHISVQDDDDVWLWSRLGEYSEMVLNQRSADILQALLPGCHFARSGQLQLGVQDGELVLKLLVHPKYLTDGHVFSDALNGFFEELDCFCGSLLR